MGFSNRQVVTPGTIGILVLVVAGFLVSFLTNGQALAGQLGFEPSLALQRIWTFVTYPYSYPPGAFVSVLFICLWLFSMGGMVERELGTPKYIAFWVVMTALGGLMFWVGWRITGIQSALFGAFMPTAAVTVAWGTRNPEATVMVMFVLPLKGKWIAWIAAALVFFGTSAQLALFAASPLLLAYFFAAEKIPGIPFTVRAGGSRASARERREQQRKFTDFREKIREREQERAERERLRKLFESSLDDDNRAE